MPYTNFEIDKCLESMVLLVDTREQPTERLKERLEAAGLPYERAKLDVGILPANVHCRMEKSLIFPARAVIERKMNLDELCMCFGRERRRFEREFERAKSGRDQGIPCLWREITGRKPIMVSTAVSLPRRP